MFLVDGVIKENNYIWTENNKKDYIRIARSLCYGEECIKELKCSKSEKEASAILCNYRRKTE